MKLLNVSGLVATILILSAVAHSSPDTARRYLAISSELAKKWDSSARLTSIRETRTLQQDGSTKCNPDKPSSGWTYEYTSSSTDDHFFVFGCGGSTATLHQVLNGIPKTEGLKNDFMDSDSLIKVANKLKQEWGHTECGVDAWLHVKRRDKKADGRTSETTIWQLTFYCEPEMKGGGTQKLTASADIDAKTGMVLYKRSPVPVGE